jgi:hypothetical protein
MLPISGRPGDVEQQILKRSRSQKFAGREIARNVTEGRERPVSRLKARLLWLLCPGKAMQGNVLSIEETFRGPGDPCSRTPAHHLSEMLHVKRLPRFSEAAFYARFIARIFQAQFGAACLSQPCSQPL